MRDIDAKWLFLIDQLQEQAAEQATSIPLPAIEELLELSTLHTDPDVFIEKLSQQPLALRKFAQLVYTVGMLHVTQVLSNRLHWDDRS